MNKPLPRSLRRLLVMSAFAGANHRLIQPVQAICLSLPNLITDNETRHQCAAVLQILLDSADLASPDYQAIAHIAASSAPSESEN